MENLVKQLIQVKGQPSYKILPGSSIGLALCNIVCLYLKFTISTHNENVKFTNRIIDDCINNVMHYYSKNNLFFVILYIEGFSSMCCI